MWHCRMHSCMDLCQRASSPGSMLQRKGMVYPTSTRRYTIDPIASRIGRNPRGTHLVAQGCMDSLRECLKDVPLHTFFSSLSFRKSSQKLVLQQVQPEVLGIGRLLKSYKQAQVRFAATVDHPAEGKLSL